MNDHTKSWNDGIEVELKAAGIPYQLKFPAEYDAYTQSLKDSYELSESAKLEIFASTRTALNYAHLDNREWPGHTVLSQVFAGEEIYMRCRESESDRLFVIDGAQASTAIDFFGGGKCVMFLPDFSFLLVDHFSSNIIYDGERNDFFCRADSLLRTFYKK